MTDTPGSAQEAATAQTATARPPASAASPAAEGGWDPIGSLRRQIDRLFEDLDGARQRPLAGWPGAGLDALRGWGMFGQGMPALDLVDRDDRLEVRVDLPGLSRDDIEVRLGDGVLTIRGERAAEREETDADFHLHERSRGRFQRSLRLPAGVDADRVEASLSDGVLAVTLPKTAAARASERRIAIRSA